MDSLISVNIITKNEENNIAECIDSVAWADEIIVVDSGSTDRTEELCRRDKVKFFFNKWGGFAPQRAFALNKSNGDWVFVIDADERVTPELKDEVVKTVSQNNTNFNGYKIARRSYCLGKWVKYNGWYPGYQMRLFRKSSTRVADRLVHEGYEVSGNTGILNSDFLHYTLENIEQFMTKVNRCAILQAIEKEGRKKVGFSDIFLHPLATFIRGFIFKKGFLDGTAGLIIAYFDVITNMLTYMNLYQLQKKSKSKTG